MKTCALLVIAAGIGAAAPRTIKEL